ncbi:hypothetical protein DAI22_07g129100 [Oryza sativa Japonica Group]|nr:hypothetical protein DAI22_07g129100 [Oryza sativa Japonica Group]
MVAASCADSPARLSSLSLFLLQLSHLSISTKTRVNHFSSFSASPWFCRSPATCLPESSVESPCMVLVHLGVCVHPTGASTTTCS